MSNNKQKNPRNNKKQIETALGQATPASIEQQEIQNLSILQNPINTNIIDIKPLLSSDNATVEIQNYVNYECDILYECRLCRAIFRSLANFIQHKRNYCTQRFTRRLSNSENSSGFINEETINANLDKDYDKELNKKGLTLVLEKYKKQEMAELPKTVLTNSDISIDIQNYNQTSNEDDCLSLKRIGENDQDEEPNHDNTNLMESEVMKIHGKFDNNKAVLGVGGKICDFTITKIRSNIPKQDLVCTECNFKFPTKKTLTSHIKYKHNKTCKIYPCPDCKETFANAWSVYRHLDNVHKWTQAQMRRVRLQVTSKAITKEQNIINNNKNKKNKLAEQNQVKNNLECDGALQTCGDCGKKFERRATLQSHSQTCLRSKQQQKPTTTSQNNPIEATIKQSSDLLILEGLAKRKSNKFKLNNDIYNKNEAFCDNGGLANIKIVDVAEIFNRKQQINVNTESIFDIFDSTKQNLPNKIDDGLNSLSSSSNDSNDNNRDEIYISDDSSPELHQFNHADDVDDNDKALKRLKLSSAFITTTLSSNNLDYLTNDADENLILKASPYMNHKDFKCISCQTYYASRYQLLWHMSLHFSWYRYQCAKCSFMSFNRSDCVDHAYLIHATTVKLIDNIVLSIPKWKIINMSHDFIKLDSNKLHERNVPKPLKKSRRKQQSNDNKRLDVILKKQPNIYIDDNINNNDNGSNRDDIETVELLDDENDPLANNENENVLIGTEILKNKVVINNRPVRTRTKSYKTDFIYDLGKVLKLNDNAMKNSFGKLKKK